MEILDKEAIKSILESNLIIDDWKLSQGDAGIIISISLQASYWLDEITNIEKTTRAMDDQTISDMLNDKEVSDIISRHALIGQKSNTIFLNLSLLFFIVFNIDLSSSIDMLNI